ncbi:MAG: hypothetical protein J7L07_02760 [Candidatus Odinarchaeota archaeon]|nr:hypothetical protein [Candidatus Odinarchaeota archaeon]
MIKIVQKILKSKIRNEKDLVNIIYKKLNRSSLFDLKSCISLLIWQKKEFENIWSGWYEGIMPPKLEVDLILAFKDLLSVIDDALIIGVEVKYFKDFKGKGFYEGLGQVLSYSIFGFDGLSLWHLFSKDLDEKKFKTSPMQTKR